MKQLIILLLLVAGFGATNLDAQSRKEKKMQATINKLMELPFIEEYKGYKKRVERTTFEFKAREAEFDAAEVATIRYNYSASCKQFDDILFGIRNDLLSREERQRIADNKVAYGRRVSHQLNGAMAEFEQNVANPINKLMGEEPVGFSLTDIKLLVDLMVEVWDTVNGIDRELEKMQADYLDEQFTKNLLIASYTKLGEETEQRRFR